MCNGLKAERSGTVIITRLIEFLLLSSLKESPTRNYEYTRNIKWLCKSYDPVLTSNGEGDSWARIRVHRKVVGRNVVWRTISGDEKNISCGEELFLAMKNYLWRCRTISGDEELFLAVKDYFWRRKTISGDWELFLAMKNIFLAVKNYFWRSKKYFLRWRTISGDQKHISCGEELFLAIKKYFLRWRTISDEKKTISGDWELFLAMKKIFLAVKNYFWR